MTDSRTAWGSSRAYRVAKRVLDVVLSGAAVVGLSPLMAACAVAVRATSPGPVLFRQERTGIHGSTFEMYKFRTMRTDAPQLPSHMIDAGEWLTPVGGFLRSTSLDELPQVANILRGDMSIVGPRPPLPSQTDLIAAREEGGANDVPPGLTGLAQVSGRDELPIARKAALDVEYARTASLALDARLVMMTFAKVFRREGVVEAEVPEPGARRTGKEGA
jgi:O-antigen biosynthesis protein WbqP